MQVSSAILFALVGGVLLVPGEYAEIADVPGLLFELLVGHIEELSYRLENVSKQMDELEHRLENRMAKQIDVISQRIKHMDQKVGLHRIVGPDGHLRAVYRETVEIDSFGQGWTVMQRRTSEELNFDRLWLDYRNGFGNVEGDHWLGLELVRSILTTSERHELLVVLETFSGEVGYAHYDDFKMGDERDNYRLDSLGNYSGTIGDGLRYHERSAFSTKDKDNDTKSGNCANNYRGGWWFHRCLDSFLNGVYSSDADTSGMQWTRDNAFVHFKKTTMMIR